MEKWIQKREWIIEELYVHRCVSINLAALGSETSAAKCHRKEKSDKSPTEILHIHTEREKKE